jgi:hypothetical protein
MEAQPSRLAQARNWYLQSVDALPADGWTGPTLCEGWTAANVVADVVTGDQLIQRARSAAIYGVSSIGPVERDDHDRISAIDVNRHADSLPTTCTTDLRSGSSTAGP